MPGGARRAARLQFDLDTGRWQVIVRPVDHPLAKEWRVTSELDDGVIVRGLCRLVWTPEAGDEALFEGIERWEQR